MFVFQIALYVLFGVLFVFAIKKLGFFETYPIEYTVGKVFIYFATWPVWVSSIVVVIVFETFKKSRKRKRRSK